MVQQHSSVISSSIAMDKQISSKQARILEKLAEEARIEEERVQDVLLLLHELFKREEVAARLIIDRLYDVASIHLINERIRCRPINRAAKWVAQRSKPIAKVAGSYYLKENCPKLIVKWLVPQAKELFGLMENKQKRRRKVAQAVVGQISLAELDNYNQEILRLRSQVRVLSSVLFLAIATIGGALVWVGYNFRTDLIELTHPVQSAIWEKVDRWQNWEIGDRN